MSYASLYRGDALSVLLLLREEVRERLKEGSAKGESERDDVERMNDLMAFWEWVDAEYKREHGEEKDFTEMVKKEENLGIVDMCTNKDYFQYWVQKAQEQQGVDVHALWSDWRHRVKWNRIIDAVSRAMACSELIGDGVVLPLSRASSCCQACGLSQPSSDHHSPLVRCTSCGLTVHEDCVSDAVSRDAFLCDKCSFLISGGHPSFVHCCICYASDGVLYRCQSDANTPVFCHLWCAICHSDVSVTNAASMTLSVKPLPSYEGVSFSLPSTSKRTHYTEGSLPPPPSFYRPNGEYSVPLRVRVKEKAKEQLAPECKVYHQERAFLLTSVASSTQSKGGASKDPSSKNTLCYICSLPVGSTVHCADASCSRSFHVRCLWVTGGAVRLPCANSDDTQHRASVEAFCHCHVEAFCHRHSNLHFSRWIRTVRTRNAHRLPCPLNASKTNRCDCCGLGDVCPKQESHATWLEKDRADIEVLSDLVATEATRDYAIREGGRGKWWRCVGCGCKVHATCSMKERDTPLFVRHNVQCTHYSFSCL